MERVSAKHGARLDDELARETESITRGAPLEARAEEWRMAEPPADDEPLPDARIASAVHGGDDPSGALPIDEIEARAELAAALRPTAFPADAPTLRRVAEQGAAARWIVELFDRVDPVSRYETVGELWRAAGGHRDAGNGRAPDVETPALAPAPERPSAAAPAPSGRATGPVAPRDPAERRAADRPGPRPRNPLERAVSVAFTGPRLVARAACVVTRQMSRVLSRR